MDDDDEYEVGYGKPPLATRIKPGERRNPKGRPKKKKEPVQRKSDADILDMLDNELVPFKGGLITKHEAQLRILHGKALAGDMKAHQILESMRKSAKVEASERKGGALLVPVVGSFADWSAAAAIQQAQFRGEVPDDGSPG